MGYSGIPPKFPLLVFLVQESTFYSWYYAFVHYVLFNYKNYLKLLKYENKETLFIFK